jgi:ribonuclease HI
MTFAEQTRRPVELWTDGSGGVTGTPGGWAYVLRTRTREGWAEREGAGSEESTTSNRMEITAVLEGLRALKSPCAVRVLSDSQYVVNTFAKGWIGRWKAKGWRKVKNADLWKAVLVAGSMHRLDFVWVRGHNGTALNERCDELAGAQRAIVVARRERYPSLEGVVIPEFECRFDEATF